MSDEHVPEKTADEQVPDEDRADEVVVGLHRMVAPEAFASEVEETIRKRSAGRFFGKKRLGDRIPFEWLALIALAVGVALYLLMRASHTGSARPPETQPDTGAARVAPGAHEAVPRP